MLRLDNDKRPVVEPMLGRASWVSGQSELPLFIDGQSPDLQSADDFLRWVGAHRALVDQLVLKYGGIVFKQSPLRTAAEFNALMELFPPFEAGYVGGSAPRAAVAGRVMESTRMAPEFKINLHQEMAYLQHYPARVAFFCVTPAAEGGETTIGSMREFTRRLPAAIREKLERHGVRGVRNYTTVGARRDVARHTDDMSWDETFGTRDREEVNRICASMDMEAHWNANGSLTVLSKTDPFAVHPVTGERFYRTIIHSNYSIYDKYDDATRKLVDALRAFQKFPTGYVLGNGEPLSREECQQLLGNFEDITLGWKWQQGDVMILDNLQTAHGRNSYKGERLTLVALLN